MFINIFQAFFIRASVFCFSFDEQQLFKTAISGLLASVLHRATAMEYTAQIQFGAIAGEGKMGAKKQVRNHMAWL